MSHRGQVVKTRAPSPALTPAWPLDAPVVGLSQLRCSLHFLSPWPTSGTSRLSSQVVSWPSVPSCLWGAPLPSAAVCLLVCLVHGHVPLSGLLSFVLGLSGSRLPEGLGGEHHAPCRASPGGSVLCSLPVLGGQRGDMKGRWLMAAFP